MAYASLESIRLTGMSLEPVLACRQWFSEMWVKIDGTNRFALRAPDQRCSIRHMIGLIRKKRL